jgi:hypothetical protein
MAPVPQREQIAGTSAKALPGRHNPNPGTLEPPQKKHADRFLKETFSSTDPHFNPLEKSPCSMKWTACGRIITFLNC